MDKLRQSLRSNVKLMKSEINRYALFGTLIAIGALILATAINAHLQSGQITIGTLIKAQQTNVTLWFMDAMPFIFAFWGQYASTIMAYEAGSMVMEQTEDLRGLTVQLEHKAVHEATHDSLTGLPNRVLLYDRLNHAIQRASRRKTGLVMTIRQVVLSSGPGHEFHYPSTCPGSHRPCDALQAWFCRQTKGSSQRLQNGRHHHR